VVVGADVGAAAVVVVLAEAVVPGLAVAAARGHPAGFRGRPGAFRAHPAEVGLGLAAGYRPAVARPHLVRPAEAVQRNCHRVDRDHLLAATDPALAVEWVAGLTSAAAHPNCRREEHVLVEDGHRRCRRIAPTSADDPGSAAVRAFPTCRPPVRAQ
jgi:hypothetical protein